MTNIHRDKASKHKASQGVSESSECFYNFSAQKQENIKNKDKGKNRESVAIELKLLSLLSLKPPTP